MRFEWDERKRRINIKVHGIDFLEAPAVFQGRMLVNLGNKDDYGEARYIGIGFLRTLVVVVVFTEPHPETIRIISLRRATKNEEERFKKAIPD